MTCQTNHDAIFTRRNLMNRRLKITIQNIETTFRRLSRSACCVICCSRCIWLPVSPIAAAIILGSGWNRRSTQNIPSTGTRRVCSVHRSRSCGLPVSKDRRVVGARRGSRAGGISLAVYGRDTSPRRSADAVAIATMRGKNPAPLQVRVPHRYPHVSVFAASGGGKSSCYAFPYLLDCPDSMVVLDSKGEL